MYKNILDNLYLQGVICYIHNKTLNLVSVELDLPPPVQGTADLQQNGVKENIFTYIVWYLGIHGRIPGRASSEPDACLECGLAAALPLLSTEPDTQTKVLLVTSATERMEITPPAGLNVPVYAIAFR